MSWDKDRAGIAEAQGRSNQCLAQPKIYLMRDDQLLTLLTILCYVCRQEWSSVVLWEAPPNSAWKQMLRLIAKHWVRYREPCGKGGGKRKRPGGDRSSTRRSTETIRAQRGFLRLKYQPRTMHELDLGSLQRSNRWAAQASCGCPSTGAGSFSDMDFLASFLITFPWRDCLVRP